MLAAGFALVLGTAREAGAQAFTLTLGADQSFTWTSATNTLNTTYTLRRSTLGFVTPTGAGSSAIGSVVDGLSLNFNAPYTFSACYAVVATNALGLNSTTNTQCHSYLHTTALGHVNGVSRVDGNGGQIGFNGLWQFTYFIDEDAFVSLRVYNSSVPFYTDANGFSDYAGKSTTTVVKTILNGAPRTGELVSTSNVDFWDSRNSSGTLVPNGIYKLHWIVQDINGNIVHKTVTTVPVDVLRITAFNTTGIAASGGNATINYTITSDASVRLLIAKPGRTLVLDGNGDIQALDPTNNLIDTSTGSVVQIINFNRSAGSKTEQWNGTDASGVAVSSGVYVAGISAKDSFGNQATGPTSDQQPISATIAVDRTAQQVAIDNTAPTINSVTVGGVSTVTISLGGGTSVSTFTTITFGLSETAGSGSNVSVISLSGPGGVIDGGVISVSGSTVTYSSAPSHNNGRISAVGTYTITIVAKDSFGNGTAPTTFNFNIPAPVAPTVTSIAVGGKAISTSGGSDAQAFQSVVVELSPQSPYSAGTGVNTSTISVSYGGVVIGTATATSGNTLTWSTTTVIASTGAYSMTINARDSNGTAAVAKVVTFNLPVPSIPPVTFKLTLGANQLFSWSHLGSLVGTTYLLYRRAGLLDPLEGYPLVKGTLIAAPNDNLFLTRTIDFKEKYPGTACYVMIASNTVSGNYATSDTVCHSFMHSTGNGSDDGVTRTDSAGTQVGFNNLWKLDYFMDQDAFVTIKVYESSVTFAADANGFQEPTGYFGLATTNIPPVKVVLSSAPRSGELFEGLVKNTDFWDSRNSSGTLVKNGIYFMHFTVRDTNGNIVHKTVTTVPVDVLRITEFSTTGLAAAGGNATIKYTITADASVRLLIAKPGRKLTVDANGDVQSLNSAGTAIDLSTDSIVQIINFNRSGGPQTEQWNGTDINGVAVASGVYVAGISAKDSYGNQATGPTDDQLPIAGTIAVDRTAQQTATDNTPPVISSVTVGSISISQSGGTPVSAFTTITVALNETAGTGSNLSNVSLTGPAGPIAGGIVTASGNNVTYSTATTQTSTGTYSITVTARDSFGNGTSPTAINFNIPTPVPPSVSSAAAGAVSISLSGGTNAAAFTTIKFFLSLGPGAVAGTGANISTITLTYGAQNLGGTTSSSGADNVVTWSTTTAISSTGTYTVTIAARDSLGSAAAAPVPVTFQIPTTAGGTGGTMTSDAFKASVVPFPNPTKTGPMAINFTVAASASVDFDLYTLSGQRVFHQTRTYGAGAQTFNWTLVNDSGGTVASGVYLLRITANDGSNILKASKKVMILR